jgi:hypothetical protein
MRRAEKALVTGWRARVWPGGSEIIEKLRVRNPLAKHGYGLRRIGGTEAIQVGRGKAFGISEDPFDILIAGEDPGLQERTKKDRFLLTCNGVKGIGVLQLRTA